MYQKLYHKYIKIFICCYMFCYVFSFAQINVDAAVKSSIKNGICTVSGTGKMTQKYECNKKIKKVVIKKGVTYIPKSAFCGCKNLKSVSIANTVKSIDDYAFANTGLKTITVPKSVKKIGYFSLGDELKKIKIPGNCKLLKWHDDNDDGSEVYFCEVAKKVELTTPLDLKMLDYLDCEYIITSDSDNKYKSIDGAIYSKNGKVLIRIPHRMKRLSISSECETVNFSAFKGKSLTDYDYPSLWLRYITIPETVKNMRYDEENTLDCYVDLPELKRFEIHSSNFGNENVLFFLDHFVLSKVLLDGLSEAEYINYTDGFLLGDLYYNCTTPDDAYVLYGYYGDDEDIIIPENVQIIKSLGENDRIRKVTMGSNVTKIDSYGLSNLDNLTEVVLNDGLIEIESRAFEGSCNIAIINIPDTLIDVHEDAFWDNDALDVDSIMRKVEENKRGITKK